MIRLFPNHAASGVEMTDEELLKQLDDADYAHQDAKRKLATLKRECIEAETVVINCKLHKDRVAEALRVHIATTPRPEKSLQDLEIERFRETYPELCEWARQRDEHKEK